ncbi:54S ribosomal protein L28, mitochondrial [Psilocybe cubensis]|uniref:54S ribosomal protein L28, mitochondrial n=2 Tax=Psilocybe cubensis TaxID=181762 RepID=A0ACB8HGT7_PSICU|nr:54S ribosomal protein L28, mitochondrial [Psilocybe cubensis]KAH9486350.1 54S ribosomal protein L28, mitochondrial [Psilocybe cubensis]
MSIYYNVYSKPEMFDNYKSSAANMSNSLIRSAKSRLPIKTLAAIRHYAAPGLAEIQNDPQKEIIRRVLYPANLRNKATPTGTWRPDVGRALRLAIPSVQAHETIERAWLLHKRHIRKAREAETARKFECMKRAMDVLHEVDQRLFMEANKKDDPRARLPEEVEAMKNMKVSHIRALEARIRGLFPRELRIPTDTPSRTGWKYEWQAINRHI